jgi:hypothetical protein
LDEEDERVLLELGISERGRTCVIENRGKALKCVPEGMRELGGVMEECLKIDSKKRPGFHVLVGELHEIRKKNKLKEKRKNPLTKFQ